ncbi:MULTISPECIES: hypothetical protein [unclassified Nocardioides]|uniref:hypothetical protein n=1 Tax=unclassified Nocardioides TaxID=2615069 RepID=UPI0000570CEC|nr:MULTISPECIES: hypothetical protein [unclassified Nocardioides]ABL79522.1 hypothetical protein Noca_4943 [Nocardioides sp. JS614]
MTSTSIPAAVGETEDERRCWCCGTPNPPARLLQLNDHPEVDLCLACASYLALRAGERRDQLRPSLTGRLRDVMRAGRRQVVDHGWHRLPIIGPVLRWVGRFTP